MSRPLDLDQQSTPIDARETIARMEAERLGMMQRREQRMKEAVQPTFAGLQHELVAAIEAGRRQAREQVRAQVVENLGSGPRAPYNGEALEQAGDSARPSRL
jgi:hypothetical protein